MRVLVVCKSEDVCTRAREALRDAAETRFTVEWASTCEAGLSRLAAGEFDAALVDYHLGGKTGLDLVHELQARGGAVPCVLLTGRGDRELGESALRSGAVDCLGKDELKPRLLERTLRYAVERFAALGRLQKALFRARQMASALAQLRQGVVLADAGSLKNPITYANPALLQFTGLAKEEVLGRPLAEFLKACLNVPPQNIQRVLKTGQSYNAEVSIRKKDGGQLWLDLKLDPFRDDEHRLTGFVGVLTDISQRKEAEEVLKHSEAYHRALAENALDIVALLSKEGTLQYVSPSVEKMQGFTPRELVGRNVFEFVHPEDLSRARSDLERVLKWPEAVISSKLRLRTKSGDYHVLEIIGQNRLEDPGVRAVVLNARDVTDRERAERKVQDLLLKISADNEQLQRLDEMKGDFLSIVSHELRTPLTSIQGYLKLLRGGAAGRLQKEQRDFVDASLRNAERLFRLVNDLLDLSKLESGKMSMEATPLDPKILMTKAVESVRNLAEQKGLKLLDAVPAGLPEFHADGPKLERVLINLLSNAIKFTPKGGTVTAGARMESRDGQEGILFWIRDTGIGIAPEDLPRVFDKFFQVESSTTRKSTGSGLGLSICRRIVEAHGGEIQAESKPGKGSTFSFFIPQHGFLASGSAP